LQDDDALGAIMHQLQTRDLGDYNIAGRAPDTDAKLAMKKTSGNDVVQWMAENDGKAPFCYNVVAQDEVLQALPDFMRGRVSMKVLREALEFFDGVPYPIKSARVAARATSSASGCCVMPRKSWRMGPCSRSGSTTHVSRRAPRDALAAAEANERDTALADFGVADEGDEELRRLLN